jgi:hypothetical protein
MCSCRIGGVVMHGTKWNDVPIFVAIADQQDDHNEDRVHASSPLQMLMEMELRIKRNKIITTSNHASHFGAEKYLPVSSCCRKLKITNGLKLKLQGVR